MARDVYLPGGGGVDVWRAAAYDSAGGGFVLGAATVLEGGRTVTLPAPLEELPFLARAGAILPLLPPDVDTLADYGDPTPGLVELDDRRDRLVLLAFPRGRSEAPLYRGEHLRSLERRGRWELTIRGTRRRVYRVEASLATLARPFIPCAVEWNGRALAPDEWTYDARTRVLRAGWTGRRGHLVVREGC
jgi:hypothetical protein